MVNAYSRGKGVKRSADGQEKPGHTGTPATDSYGCVNFNPSSLPDVKTEDQLNDMKAFLLEESFKLEPERNKTKDKEYIDKTYVLQRWAINKKDPVPSVGSLREAWPLLFELDYMVDHFQHLTGIDVKTKFKSNLAEKRDRLMNFISMKISKMKGVKEHLAQIAKAGEDSSLAGALIIQLIAVCFGEDPDLLIKKYEGCTNDKEVESKTKILTPHVAVIGSVTNPSAGFFLVVEKKVVTQNIKCLLYVIIMVFAAYYVLNMQYEVGLTGTLEFIQRCSLNLNPSSGSRSKMRRTDVPNKVLSFLNALDDFDWNV